MEPAGPTGAGRDRSGPGGQSDQPAAPTRGPGIVGGPAPVYPKDALDGGLEGRVSLSVTIAADGSVSAVGVAKTSGHKLLDEAAVRAVKRGWTFQPALKNGKPAAGTMTVTFEFAAGKVQSQ
jgi:protein TonB